MFMLERAELYIIPEPLTKNRTCQTRRWKQVAMCEDLKPLLEMKKINETPTFILRVIDLAGLKVVS